MASEPIQTIIGGSLGGNEIPTRPAANTSRRMISSGVVRASLDAPPAGIADSLLRAGTESSPSPAPYVSIFGPFDDVDVPSINRRDPGAHAPGYPHRFSRADCSLCRRATEVYTDTSGPYQAAPHTSFVHNGSGGIGPTLQRITNLPVAAAPAAPRRAPVHHVPPSSASLPHDAPYLQIANVARARIMYLEIEAGRLELSHARLRTCHALYTSELFIAGPADIERRARMILLRHSAEVDMARVEISLRQVEMEHYHELQRAERAENILLLRTALDSWYCI